MKWATAGCQTRYIIQSILGLNSVSQFSLLYYIAFYSKSMTQTVFMFCCISQVASFISWLVYQLIEKCCRDSEDQLRNYLQHKLHVSVSVANLCLNATVICTCPITLCAVCFLSRTSCRQKLISLLHFDFPSLQTINLLPWYLMRNWRQKGKKASRLAICLFTDYFYSFFKFIWMI